jgi:hypothetical protein
MTAMHRQIPKTMQSMPIINSSREEMKEKKLMTVKSVSPVIVILNYRKETCKYTYSINVHLPQM